MKRKVAAGWKAALLGAAALFGLAGVPAGAAQTVRVLVDDVPLTLIPAPAVQDGLLYLPLRPLAQHFQASLAVDRQVIEVRRADGVILTVRLGRLEVWSGGIVVGVAEAPVVLLSGTTMIPRGAVDMLFDTLTVWNQQDGVVTIVSPQRPVQVTTTAKPAPVATRAGPAVAAVRTFDPEFRPEIERPVVASGYVTVGLAVGSEATATGRVQFRTYAPQERVDGSVAVVAGSSAVGTGGTVTLRRPDSTLTLGGIVVHDSPLTLYEQGLVGILYQTDGSGSTARIFGGSIPQTAAHVYGVNIALAPVGQWLLQGTMLYDPASGAIVLKGRGDHPLRPGLVGFAETAWGGSLAGSGTAWRLGLQTGSPALTTTVSYLSLAPGFPTMGNAALFSGRSGPMIQLSSRPGPRLAVSASAASLRGAAGVPDREVTSLLVHYRPAPAIGLVGEMRTVDDTVSGVRTSSTSALLALTFTTGRWGLVVSGGHVANANVSLGTTGTTSTLSLRAGYTLLSGLPVWAEISQTTGDTTAFGSALGWTFRAGRAADLTTQVRHKVYTLPSAYAETSLELGLSQSLASGAHLTVGGGARYASHTGVASPYLALQYGYPVAAYGPPQTGRLAALMYVDRNGNGQRDPDEPPVGGVVVRINDRTAAMSDQDGSAEVSGVRAGEVRVAVDGDTVPAHLVATQPAQTVRVTATQTTRVEFALAPAAAIVGVVFLDENSNGRRDPDEKVVPGVILHLLGTGLFRTSGVDGSFEFAHLAPGHYTVIVDQRALPFGVRVRGDGSYGLTVEPGGAMTLEVPLDGRPVIRTF